MIRLDITATHSLVYLLIEIVDKDGKVGNVRSGSGSGCTSVQRRHFNGRVEHCNFSPHEESLNVCLPLHMCKRLERPLAADSAGACWGDTAILALTKGFSTSLTKRLYQ
jgi:hypothetical protein